jgi:hypothetical protein
MDFAVAPSLWFIIVTIGAAALGLALAYGTVMWRRRSRDPVVQQIREEATKDLYAQEAEEERNSDARKDAA